MNVNTETRDCVRCGKQKSQHVYGNGELGGPWCTEMTPLLTDDEMRLLRMILTQVCESPRLWHHSKIIERAFSEHLRLRAELTAFRSTVARLTGANDVMHDDIASLLRALGLSDSARSESPHLVMVNECIPEAKRLRMAAEATP